MAKKLTTQEKEDDLDDKVLYEVSEAKGCPMTVTKNGCGVCDRVGFPLFLVRKAVIKKNYKNISWSKDTLKLQDRELDALSTHEYAYRTLRTGYVYILAKQYGKYEYLGYEVTPSGVFRHKTINNMVERNIRDIPSNCTKKNDHISGAFITIDTSIHKDAAYVAYTRRAWSDSALDYYREAANAGDIEKLKRFSTILLTENGFKEPKLLSPEKDIRTFAFDDFKSKVKLMELELDPKEITYIDADDKVKKEQSSITTEEVIDNFITTHQFNSFKVNRYDSTKSCVDELFKKVSDLESKRQNTKVGVLVLEDTFGIAEELSYQRQLLVEPIVTTVVKAEEFYAKELNSIYQQRLNSLDTEDKYETLLEDAIKDYEKMHPEESKYMYGDLDETYGGWKTDFYGDQYSVVVDIPENYFLKKEYLNKYNALYLGDFKAYAEYFNEKNFHLRKILNYITDCKNQLYAKCCNLEPEITTQFCWYTGDGRKVTENGQEKTNIMSGNEISIYRNSSMYVEIPLTEKDKKRLLDEKNGKKSSFIYTDVARFKENINDSHSIKSIKYRGEKLFEKEWKELEDRLNLKRFEIFQNENKKLYLQIVDDINLYSSDYYNYLGWLFGGEKRKSALLPKIKKYNNAEFWLIECDTNCSNNHVGYLKDFVKMIDFTVVGQIPISEQDGVWDILLQDNETIYYRLFHGGSENNFWDLLIQSRLKQDDDNSGLPEDKKTLEQALKDIEKQEFATPDKDKILDKRFFYEKGEVISKLYTLITNKSTAAYAQIKNKTNLTLNHNLFRSHLCQSLMAFGKCYAIYTQVSVGIENIDKYIQLNNRTMSMFFYDNDEEIKQFVEDIKNYSLGDIVSDTPSTSNINLQKIFDIAKVAESGRDLWGFLQSINAQGGMRGWNDFMASFKHPSVNGQFGLGYGKSAVLSFNASSYTTNWSSAIKGEIFSGFLNAISFVLESSALDQNKTELENAETGQIGQINKEQLIQAINFGYMKKYCTLVTLIESMSKIINIGEALLNSGSAAPIIEGLSVNIMRATTYPAYVANGILGAIAVLEGFQTWDKANEMEAAGEYGLAVGFRICAVLQVVSGLVMLAKGIGILALFPGVGGILYLCAMAMGLVAAIIMLIIKDESADWTPMQHWFNRCLFGNWKFKLRDQPYPANFLGMGVAGNDYFVALKGIISNIEFQTESAYIRQIAAQKYGEMSQEDVKKEMIKFSGFLNSVEKINNVGDERQQLINLVSRADQKQFCRGLYVQFFLPEFDEDNSHFEAQLFITQLDESMTLQIEKNYNENEIFPQMTVKSGSLSHFFMRSSGIKIDDDERGQQIIDEQITKPESYGFYLIEKYDPVTRLPILDENDVSIKEKTNCFKVTYKVGEFSSTPCIDIVLKLKYWVDKNAQDSLPWISTFSFKTGRSGVL